MGDDLVKRICQEWIDDGRADDCFWEGWPECPTPEDSLTPSMVFDRIEELEAERERAWKEADAWLGKYNWAVCDKEAAEAKLAKIVAIVRSHDTGDMQREDMEVRRILQKIEAELTGGQNND